MSFTSGSDFGFVLLCGVASFGLVVFTFWLGFYKAAGLFLGLGAKNNGQTNPIALSNLSSLFLLPVAYMFLGTLIWIFCKTMASLVWDVNFQEGIKYFLEFRYLNYVGIIEGLTTNKELADFLSAATSMASSFIFIFIVSMPALLFCFSLAFSMAAIGFVNPHKGQGNWAFGLFVVLSTLFLTTVLVVFYSWIANKVFFETPVNVDDFGTISSVADGMGTVVKYYTKEALQL